METNKQDTLGKSRVRVGFNPSEKDNVSKIKMMSADLIDLVSSVEDGTNQGEHAKEIVRLKDLAMTAYEEAAMWAVKAATLSK